MVRTRSTINPEENKTLHVGQIKTILQKQQNSSTVALKNLYAQELYRYLMNNHVWVKTQPRFWRVTTIKAAEFLASEEQLTNSTKRLLQRYLKHYANDLKNSAGNMAVTFCIEAGNISIT